jgi:hypothetical protein
MNKRKLYSKIAAMYYFYDRNFDTFVGVFIGAACILGFMGLMFHVNPNGIAAAMMISKLFFNLVLLSLIPPGILFTKIFLGNININKKPVLKSACKVLDEEYDEIQEKLSNEKNSVSRAIENINKSTYIDYGVTKEIADALNQQLSNLQQLGRDAKEEQKVFQAKFQVMFEEIQKAEEIEQVAAAVKGIGRRDELIANTRQHLINLHMLIEGCCNNLGQLDIRRSELRQSALPEVQELYN